MLTCGCMYSAIYMYLIAQYNCKCDSESQCNVNVDIRSYNGPFLQVLEAGYAWNQMLKEAMLS